VRQVLQQRCNETDAEQILEQAMREKGHGFGWAADLRKFRATFFHEKAPWIAMEVISQEPRKYELLILEENVADLEKDPSYVRLEEFRRLWYGLQNCALDMQRWALGELDRISRAVDGE